MKYAKVLGLLAVAAAALMAFAGSASATALTDGSGNVLPKGTIVEATSTHGLLHGTITLTCTHSLMKGEVTDPGGPAKTVKGVVLSLDFTNCGPNTITVVKPGTLEIHTDPSDPANTTVNGTLTSTGAEVTALTHNILGTIHCIYTTNNTHIGTLDGSHTTGGTATLTIDSAPITVSATDFGCGSSAEWTGDYTVLKPDPLNVH